MKAVIHLSDDYLRKYRALKQSLQLPLKISLYFNFLEAALDDQTVTKKGESFHGFSPLFYPIFCKLSNQQKSFYLFSNIEFIKAQYDKIENNLNNRQFKMHMGSNIKATGQISDTIMSLSYWQKVQMNFNFELRKIKLVSKNKNFDIDLRLFLIRKSKKYENTFVLQAISEVVPATDRKISLFFKASIFEEIFMEIFKCIINFRNLELYKVAVQDYATSQSNNEVSYIGKNSRSLNFLTAKNVNEFLNFKDKILKKMIRAQFKFDKIYSVQDCKIEKDENFSAPDFSLYKLESNFNYSVQVLKKKFLQKYHNQSYKYLIQSQQLQQSSNRYQAKYQKLLFNLSLQSFKTIQQIVIEQINLKQHTPENQQLIFLKGVKGVKLNNFIEFLMIKVKGLGTHNKSKLIIVGSFMKSFENQGKGKLKSKKTHCKIQETQQLIIMYLLEFCEMIFRKEDNEENMEKILSGLRAKSMDEMYQNYQEEKDKNQENQFQTVVGNFKSYDREEIVMNVDDFEENLNTQNEDMQQEMDTQNSKVINYNQSYLAYKFQVQPFPLQIDENREKKLPSTHFLFEEWYRKPKGGIVCKSQNAINEQKKVANFILKSLGKRIFQQKGLLNLSLPVTIFRPQSQLQSIARNLSFAPIFLQKAATMKDPVERMKYIVLYSLSVTVSSISINKPFNPLLGETLQAQIDGCPVYLQQISHHPPVACYYMVGRGYKVHGSIGSKANFGFNSITGYSQEPNFVQFDDGTIYELNFGKMVIYGIVLGERSFNFIDKMYIIDSKNKLFSELKFGEEKSSIFSSSQYPEDHFFGKIQKINDKFVEQFYKSPCIIYPTKESSEQLCKFEGMWNGKISFDKKCYTDFSVANGCTIEAEKFTLPSDCAFRKDIQFLRQGQANNSQHEKEVLQNIQRRDRQLRRGSAQKQ